MPAGEVLVCHAGTCRARGAEAAMAEIEELMAEVGGECAVRKSGCLGYCSQAPNAFVIEQGEYREKVNVHTHVRSLEASARVVKRATGTMVALAGDGVKGRLERLRAARDRKAAVEVSKWNAALLGLPQQVARMPHLRVELKSLLAKAGFPEGVEYEGGKPVMPSAISNYAPWALESVTVVTLHSAVFRFTSDDIKRGTPHPRGRGRLPQPITWHTTLLAEVGANSEGPLPWIERDYTPVSSAKEWEAGRCDILIKVYPDGAATSWLRSLHADGVCPARKVWLSKPVKTLSIPGLVAEGVAYRPASVLLLLAGTGVVALPQILAHRDPTGQLGISTPKRQQMHMPIDLLLSCREDDVLLLPQIAQVGDHAMRSRSDRRAGIARGSLIAPSPLPQWCRDGEALGVRQATLLLTPALNSHAPPPFPDGFETGDGADADRLLRDVPNARVLRQRLSAELVAGSYRLMPPPCRVVVSGPGGFNAAAREMLAKVVDVEEWVTILSA